MLQLPCQELNLKQRLPVPPQHLGLPQHSHRPPVSQGSVVTSSRQPLSVLLNSSPEPITSIWVYPSLLLLPRCTSKWEERVDCGLDFSSRLGAAQRASCLSSSGYVGVETVESGRGTTLALFLLSCLWKLRKRSVPLAQRVRWCIFKWFSGKPRELLNDRLQTFVCIYSS